MLLGLTRHVATNLNKIETRVPGFGLVGVVTLRPAAALVTECTRWGKSLQPLHSPPVACPGACASWQA